MSESRIRRSPLEIIDALYDALPANSYEPISHIAARADMDWKTAKKYLEMILHIQEKQGGDWLEFMMVGEQSAFSRRTKAGRPVKQ